MDFYCQLVDCIGFRRQYGIHLEFADQGDRSEITRSYRYNGRIIILYHYGQIST